MYVHIHVRYTLVRNSMLFQCAFVITMQSYNVCYLNNNIIVHVNIISIVYPAKEGAKHICYMHCIDCNVLCLGVQVLILNYSVILILE